MSWLVEKVRLILHYHVRPAAPPNAPLREERYELPIAQYSVRPSGLNIPNSQAITLLALQVSEDFNILSRRSDWLPFSFDQGNEQFDHGRFILQYTWFDPQDTGGERLQGEVAFDLAISLSDDPMQSALPLQTLADDIRYLLKVDRAQPERYVLVHLRESQGSPGSSPSIQAALCKQASTAEALKRCAAQGHFNPSPSGGQSLSIVM